MAQIKIFFKQAPYFAIKMKAEGNLSGKIKVSAGNRNHIFNY